jgi:peptide/nickel transport system permease protein
MVEKHRHIQFKKWLGKPFVWILSGMFLVAVFSDFLANGLPLYAQKDGQNRYPALEKKMADWGFTSNKADLNMPENWLGENITNQTWAPIRFSPNQTDRYNDRFQKPHALRDGTPQGFPHYLGTDELGHDVASVLIHGTAISFFIGVFSMFLASVIGILIGALAGFWGDHRLVSTIPKALFMFIGLLMVWFYGIQIHQARFAVALNRGGISFLGMLLISILSMILIYTIFSFIGNKLAIFNRGKKISVPVDFILSRLIEFMVVIPKIILILAVAAIAKPSILLPALVIGFTAWPSISRFTRAEMLHVRHMDYIRSAETFGISNLSIFFRHALPNSLSPIPSLVAFGIASAVLAESTLSFLGIGIPPEIFTWGKLLAQGRTNPSAWWVTLLPGLMIFLTVTCFHQLGEELQGNAQTKKSFLRYFI